MGMFPLGGSGERDPFAPFVFGRDYLLVGSSLSVDPELTMNLSLLQNLGDGTGLLIPTVNYHLLDWLDLAASAQVPYAFSEGGELKPKPEDLRVSFEVPGGPTLEADLGGLVADATITVWTRAS